MRRSFKIAGGLIAALFLAELGAGYLNFQRGSERGLALGWLSDRIGKRFEEQPTNGISMHAVYQPENDALRVALEQSYEAEFLEFLEVARLRGCHVAVLYIPTVQSYPAAHRFFRTLSAKTGTPFIDMLDTRDRYSADQLYLSPADAHPSRLMNQLTATAVAAQLARFPKNACATGSPQSNVFSGPWVPSLSEIRETAKGLAFRFTSDDQGFRTSSALRFNGGEQILLVGDSFTFGTSLADQDTWPAFLQRQLPDISVLNAGVGGISIVRQREILDKATAQSHADTIILQVNDTDLQGLTPAYWREMPREPLGANSINQVLGAE